MAWSWRYCVSAEAANASDVWRRLGCCCTAQVWLTLLGPRQGAGCVVSAQYGGGGRGGTAVLAGWQVTIR